jgi:hypothetical protein
VPGGPAALCGGFINEGDKVLSIPNISEFHIHPVAFSDLTIDYPVFQLTHIDSRFVTDLSEDERKGLILGSVHKAVRRVLV